MVQADDRRPGDGRGGQGIDGDIFHGGRSRGAPGSDDIVHIDGLGSHGVPEHGDGLGPGPPGDGSPGRDIPGVAGHAGFSGIG